VHLTLCRMVMRSKLTSFSGGDDKNHGSHSRTLETRIEVIPGRVYIHPLPQLLDNLGYLVVCCPPPETRSTSDRSHRNDGNNSQQHQLLHNNNNLSSSGTSGCCDDEGFEEEMNVGQSASSDTAASSNNNNNNYIVNNNSVVSMTSLGKITIAPQKAKNEEEAPRIVAFIVDCGDAHAVQQQLQLIQSRHYDNEMIYVQAILSTHKHHDHTAGNVPFLQLPFYGRHLKLIMGGAVERVPGCNYAVKNGQAIPLPKFGANIMQDVLHVEAVATPGHTRGSLTYILRPNPNTSNSNIDSAAAGTAASTAAANNADHHPCGYYLFTGDTVFSGGGGVPFEADLDPGQDENEAKQTFTSFVHASAAGHAVERCFAEVLARILPVDAAAPPISTLSTMSSSSSRSSCMPIMADFAALAKRSFILPGHEYTQELLGRQLRPQGGGGGTGSDGSGGGDAYKWKNFPPSYFFETASHFYTAMHRRGLPQSNGKLVTAIGAPLQRELHINPVFRTLKRRAEVLVPAILAWNKRFARNKVTSQSIRAVTAAAALLDNDDEAQEEEGEGSTTDDDYLRSNKTSSTEDCWNLNSADLSRSVFCTVYTSDMDMLMADLTQNRISTAMAARYVYLLSLNI
jgi:glyoxylase-like metal-dependent hydrolase (beta-lactamase superfamily II)